MVYQYLKSKMGDQYFTFDCYKYLCVLGKKPSHANYYLDDSEDIKLLINRLKVES